MPSLHAGSALLVALFLWPPANTLWRVALVGYVLLMAAPLVYTGEHHVVDVVAGGAERGRCRGRGPRPHSGDEAEEPTSRPSPEL